MTSRIVYESNGGTVGDGVRVTRVADGGQTLEVMVDSQAERFSRIILVDEGSKRTIDTFTSSEFTQPGDAVRAEASFHREFIEDMEPDQQVAYLLEVIEIGMAADRELIATILDHMPRGTKRRDAQLLDLFWTHRPRIMTHGYLAQRIEYLSGHHLDSTGIASNIKHLRKALVASGYPLEIETHTGVGYRLVAPDGWKAPWEAE